MTPCEIISDSESTSTAPYRDSSAEVARLRLMQFATENSSDLRSVNQAPSGDVRSNALVHEQLKALAPSELTPRSTLDEILTSMEKGVMPKLDGPKLALARQAVAANAARQAEDVEQWAARLAHSTSAADD